jgi:hypothetical protein
MKKHLSLLPIVLMLCFSLAAVLPAAAQQTLYEDGPINGQTDSFTINFGFAVSDTFTISGGNSTVNGISFGSWMLPGDTLESADVTLSSQPLGGGTVYFDGMVNFTASNCFQSEFGFNICDQTGGFGATNLSNGTYWLTLQNGIVSSGDPVYWDENSGVGCHSEGCPSQAQESAIGTIPSESFTILGTTQTGTGSAPEPSSLVLFSSGVLGGVGIAKRKLF